MAAKPIRSQPAPEPTEEPANIDRLRYVLALHARGLTHKQKAAVSGRSERTIRRWLAQARDIGLSPYTELGPEQMVTDTVDDFTEIKAELRDLYASLKVTGDPRLRLKCLQELSRLTVAVVAVYDRAGGFRQAVLPPAPVDPQAAEVAELRATARRIVGHGSGRGSPPGIPAPTREMHPPAGTPPSSGHSDGAFDPRPNTDPTGHPSGSVTALAPIRRRRRLVGK